MLLRGRRRAATLLVALGIVASIGAGLGPVTAVGRSTGAVARIEGWLEEQLDSRAAADGLVVLVAADNATTARAAIIDAGATPMRTFERIGVSAALLTPAQVEAVRRHPGVEYLQGNRSLALKGTTATDTTRVEQAESIFRGPDGAELDGTGVGIAVVDSGMAGDHPMFQDATGAGTRLLNIKQSCIAVYECSVHGDVNDLFFTDATGLDTDAMAVGGHGTHVTAISGGREVTTSTGETVRGVARNASLYGLGAGAGIFTLNSAASLNWVLEHHADPCGAFDPRPAVVGGCAPIKVVNNSYGPSEGGPYGYDPDDTLMRLSEHLVLEGVTVVWAAGNGDSPTATSPKPNDGTYNLTNPSAMSPLPGVIQVANYDDGGVGDRDNDLNSSSSRAFKGDADEPAWVHAFPDLAAPGTSILAACRPYLPICSSNYGDPNYGSISGTSMAAPHVAGVVALLLQAYPTLSPAAVEDVLEDGAHQFGDAASYIPDVATAAAPIPGQTFNGNHTTSFDKGHGLVDLATTLSSLSGTSVPPYVAPFPPCRSSTRQFTDDAGDATGVGLVPATPLPSDPTLDILRGEAFLTADGSAVRVEIGMAQVEAAPPTASSGDYYRFWFTLDGRSLQVVISRSAVPTPTSTALLSETAVNGAVIARNLPHGFDTTQDEIWAEVPLAATTEAGQTLPAFAPGTRLTEVSVLAQRQAVRATLTADEAVAPCSLVLEVDGTATSPEPTKQSKPAKPPKPSKPSKGTTTPPPPAPAESERSWSQTFTFPDAHVDNSCVETADDGRQVLVAAPSTGCGIVEIAVGADVAAPLAFLDLRLTPERGGIDDFDLYLVDAAGVVVTSSANPAFLPTTGVEQAFGRLLPPGTYRLVVQAYATAPAGSARVDAIEWGRAAFVD